VDTNLPNQCYKQPYLTAMINPIDRDPWIIRKADHEGPPYDKGQLTTIPVNDVDEDIKDRTRGDYAIRGETYLDSQFLSALRSLADCGLNTECLWMVHANAKKCTLRYWEQGLKAQEQALLTERQGLEQAKKMHNTKVMDMKR
jgi:hypothetical protein